MPRADPVLSAEVVLAPASGASLENAVITASNVKDFAPPPDAVDAARRFFAGAGFQVGDLSGISFTVSAPRSVLESVFGKIPAAAAGAAGKGQPRAKKGKSGSNVPLELPLGRLPASVRKGIRAVSFSRPLDYGPAGSFGT